jgi:nitrogen regulatory protein PII
MKKIEAIIFPAKLDAARAQLQRSGIHSALILTQVEQTHGFRLTEGECAESPSPQGRLKVELIVGERQAQKAMEVFAQYAQVASRPGESQVALLGVSQTLQIVAPLAKI